MMGQLALRNTQSARNFSEGEIGTTHEKHDDGLSDFVIETFYSLSQLIREFPRVLTDLRQLSFFQGQNILTFNIKRLSLTRF